MRQANVITFVLVAFSLFGCATASKNLMQIGTNDKSVLLQNKAVAKSLLLSQYDEWKGVKYEYGGMSRDGIDCSGFVYVTFLSKFGIKLPRNSIIQAKVGTDISVSLLQPGDILFFKTGFKTYHIGIYIENTEFMHVSESHGVTKSSFSDPYWHKRFVRARRITM
jgi:cell wall-associated NlpC family hydrolase